MGRPPREARRDQSLTPIFLILGLALGIPAVLGIGVLVVLFLLGFFVAQAARNVHDEVQAAQQEMQQNMGGNRQKPKVVLRPAPPPGVPGKKMYDLITLIDPRQDAIENRKWEIVGKELHCKDGSFVPRIQIPYQPPPEYDFIVTFSQPELRNGISLIMPNPNGGSFFWALGANGGSNYGLHAEPVIGGDVQGLVQANVACTTTVQVRRNSVRCLVDGKERLNHKTDFRDLTCDGWRQIKDTRLLAVACDDPTVFHFVRVVEISGKGRRTR